MHNTVGVNMPRESETILFQRVDNLDARVLDVEREQYALTARLSATEKAGDDVCKQLNKTDARLSVGLENVGAGLANIRSMLDKQEGERNAYKVIPIFLSVVIMLLQIIPLLKK